MINFRKMIAVTKTGDPNAAYIISGADKLLWRMVLGEVIICADSMPARINFAGIRKVTDWAFEKNAAGQYIRANEYIEGVRACSIQWRRTSAADKSVLPAMIIDHKLLDYLK